MNADEFRAFRANVQLDALGSGADENEMAQIEVYLEAFAVFLNREKKYESLWQQYGAIDSRHHMESKFLRTRLSLTYPEDLDDSIDLINYTVFFIRNLRAGRITSTAPRTEGALFIAHEDIKAGAWVKVDLETGKVVVA